MGSEDKKIPGLILISPTRIISQLSFCTKSLSAQREQKVTWWQAEGKNQRTNIPDLPTPARPKIASFTSALLAMLEGMATNSLDYQKWGRRTVPSSCLQLHHVIVTSMQSLKKNTTRMELQGARLSLTYTSFLNSHDKWCYIPTLNVAVTPLTHLALFMQNPPSAFKRLLSASGTVILKKVLNNLKYLPHKVLYLFFLFQQQLLIFTVFASTPMN